MRMADADERVEILAEGASEALVAAVHFDGGELGGAGEAREVDVKRPPWTSPALTTKRLQATWMSSQRCLKASSATPGCSLFAITATFVICRRSR